jgi:hypothetical protein
VFILPLAEVLRPCVEFHDDEKRKGNNGKYEWNIEQLDVFNVISRKTWDLQGTRNKDVDLDCRRPRE